MNLLFNTKNNIIKQKNNYKLWGEDLRHYKKGLLGTFLCDMYFENSININIIKKKLLKELDNISSFFRIILLSSGNYKYDYRNSQDVMNDILFDRIHGSMNDCELYGLKTRRPFIIWVENKTLVMYCNHTIIDGLKVAYVMSNIIYDQPNDCIERQRLPKLPKKTLFNLAGLYKLYKCSKIPRSIEEIEKKINHPYYLTLKLNDIKKIKNKLNNSFVHCLNSLLLKSVMEHAKLPHIKVAVSMGFNYRFSTQLVSLNNHNSIIGFRLHNNSLSKITQEYRKKIKDNKSSIGNYFTIPLLQNNNNISFDVYIGTTYQGLKHKPKHNGGEVVRTRTYKKYHSSPIYIITHTTVEAAHISIHSHIPLPRIKEIIKNNLYNFL